MLNDSEKKEHNERTELVLNDFSHILLRDMIKKKKRGRFRESNDKLSFSVVQKGLKEASNYSLQPSESSFYSDRATHEI